MQVHGGGRVAGRLLQHLEGMPDRQAVDLLRYHAGWNFALNRQVGDELFHPTTLVNFRQRLLDHNLSMIGFEAVLEALLDAGLVARQSHQRLAFHITFPKGRPKERTPFGLSRGFQFLQS